MKVGTWVQNSKSRIVGKIILIMSDSSILLLDCPRVHGKELINIDKDPELICLKTKVLLDLKKKYSSSNIKRRYAIITTTDLEPIRYKPGDRILNKLYPNEVFVLQKYFGIESVISTLENESFRAYKITKEYCDNWGLDYSLIGKSERDIYISDVVGFATNKQKCIECKGKL